VSKNINVNPDHYKVAGRERPDEGIARKPRRKKAADNPHQDAMREKMAARQRAKK
jgi:hypothetical protein